MAAGSSSRLGQPKQLLPFKGSTLIEHTVNECIASDIGPVYVVLGANAALVRPKVQDLSINVLENPDWESGLTSSIAFGVSHLQETDTNGVIIVLADQPYFNRDILTQIAKKKTETDASLVISQYTDGAGPPSFFDKALFPELAALSGGNGAKPLVKKYWSQASFVAFDKGMIDIDTPEDLDLLKEFEL